MPIAKFVSCTRRKGRYPVAKIKPSGTILKRFAPLCVWLALTGLMPAVAQETPASAFAAAEIAMQAEDWDAAQVLVANAGPVARDLVTWTMLRAGEGQFPDYQAFLAARPDWPGLDRLRARGEEDIPVGFSPPDVAAYFNAAKPQTGEGAARFAAALIALGRQDQAQSVLAEAWLTLSLTDEGHAAMLADFADVLAPLHVARTDAMLWKWKTDDAARMLPLLDNDQRALAEARIALIRGDGDANAKLAAVPAALRDNPGLAYDRFNRLADNGDYSDAVVILMARSISAETLGQPFRWASWRATLARWALREGRPEQAYTLATTHFLTEGDFYADLEWVAGYVSLQFLENPAQALTHFTRVELEVTGPISLARGGYWVGRAYEALGDPDKAAQAFGRAAQNQTAFYGLLAAERLGLALDPTLTGVEQFPDWRQAGFLDSDRMEAMLLLIGANDRGAAVQFVAQFGNTLDRTGIGQMGALLTQMNEPFLTVLLGKAAVNRGIILPGVTYPVHPMAQTDLPVVPELALSIARRESEFNFTVGSPVGALGLMQLMPDTAREVAGELGIAYQRARLTSEWQYNVQLGAQYLANLQLRFGYSPVLIAAGYNAGGSRPQTWMSQRGDPRLGEVDVVDWIEMIPFAETRNYVMRVTESIPIYQARLTGRTGPIAFVALLQGDKPQLRPRPRPDAGSVEPAAEILAGPQIRPVARP